MSAEELIWAVGRATLFTSVAAIVADALLRVLQIRSARPHRIAWLIVVVQGWLLVPFVWQVETAPVEPPQFTVSVQSTTFRAAELSSPPAAPAQASSELTNPVPIYRLTIAIWVCGAMLLVLWRGLRFFQFVRRLPRAYDEVDPAWLREWQRQLRLARIRRPVELRLTRDLGPLLCFVPLRYLIVVPRPLWTRLTRRERSVILRHELAHLVRGDLWWSLAIRLVALPQWFNPLVWMAIRRFDEAGEWACDDWASRRRRGRELAFARSLLKTVEFATAGPAGTVSIRGGELARRIRRLVSTPFMEDRMFKKLLPLAAIGMIVIAQSVRIERVSAEAPALPAAADAKPAPTPARSIPPSYVIEPPDILLIKAVKLIPKTPYRIEPFDSLLVRVLGALPDQPIADNFAVDPDGKIDLGPTYGRIEVAGQTVDEARDNIRHKLAEILQDPQVSVSLASWAGAQQIQGEHLVGPDGRVNLGVYGTVYLAGLTIEDACRAIEQRLSDYLEKPQVVVDVFAYNSKKYYVITQGENGGDNVAALPITGNETVLDAIAHTGGLAQRSHKIWIARPAPNGVGMERILPVNWEEISQGKSMATNYQLLPGDRVFVKDLTQPKIADAQKYCFEIDVIEDRDNELAAFDAKRGDAPFATFDSDTIRPALRILAKHQLIKQLSSPKLTCRAEQTATLQTSADGKDNSPADGLKVHVFAGEFDRGLVVQLRFACDYQGQHYEFDSSVPVKEGQTILIRANAGNWQSPVQDATPLYVALTPSVVGEKPPRSFDSTYFQVPEPPTAE